MMKMFAKLFLLFLVLSAFFVSSMIAQPLREPKSEPDTTLSVAHLLNPSFQTLSPAAAQTGALISNPFPQRNKVPARFLFGLGSAILKGAVDEPFNAPNYGTGTPPPLSFINPETMLDYELTIKRINEYTIGNR